MAVFQGNFSTFPIVSTVNCPLIHPLCSAEVGSLTRRFKHNFYPDTTYPKPIRMENLIPHDYKMNDKIPQKEAPTGQAIRRVF
jgi:hypothetical protein